MKEEFTVGDVVYLKSAGWPMVVQGVRAEWIELIWLDTRCRAQNLEFRREVLTKEQPK